MKKILYKDIVPYDAPSSLSALHGPASGVITLPITVHWGPRKDNDVADPGERMFAYRQIVREGTPNDQEELFNEAYLRELWADMILPDRCRAIWETRFPDLAA